MSLLPPWQQELRDALLAARGLVMHSVKAYSQQLLSLIAAIMPSLTMVLIPIINVHGNVLVVS